MRRQSSINFAGINSGTPLNGKLSGKYIQTFAYDTIKDRLPVILTKVLDQLSRDKEAIISANGLDAEEDIKTIVGKISKLKNEVQTNKSIIELESKNDDAEIWNKYLAELEGEDPVCWYMSPWLYIETYMYRRLQEMFEMSKALTEFDPFLKQKEEALEVAVDQLKPIAQSILHPAEDSVKRRITNALKISLWSNRCDLSLSNGVVLAEKDSLLEQVKHLEHFILADDSEKAFDVLANNSSKIVDIVHDNASFELFCDLCLADELIATGLAKVVRLRLKRMPWYVSDATERDLDFLLDRLSSLELNELSLRWRGYIDSGAFKVVLDQYWTLPCPYSEMKTRDPQLYSSLSEASMVIFKGDLNYRKLLGDINWGFSEHFSAVLRDFHPTNILALRTIKADLLCGLKPGRTEELFQKEPLWMRSGEYAVIQLSQNSNL